MGGEGSPVLKNEIVQPKLSLNAANGIGKALVALLAGAVDTARLGLSTAEEYAARAWGAGGQRSGGEKRPPEMQD
jgi:hypothetical protein